MIRMHQVLRDSVGIMAVGVEVRREDSIAEEGASALTSKATILGSLYGQRSTASCA